VGVFRTSYPRLVAAGGSQLNRTVPCSAASEFFCGCPVGEAVFNFHPATLNCTSPAKVSMPGHG